MRRGTPPCCGAASSTEIDLTWENNSTTATGFTIERSTGGGAFAAIGTADGSATTYNDTGLSPGTDYNYEVVATTSSESSAPSASTDAVTLPSSLSGLTATAASSSEVDLSWTEVTGASGYEIDRKDADGNWEAIDAVDSPGASYADTSIDDGTAYTYQVIPYNDSGDAADSNPSASATTPLLAPENVDAVALSSTSVEIVWDDQSASETGFEVQRSTDGTTFTNFGSTAAGTTDYTDTTAAASTEYWYRVESTNSAAGSSAPSAAADTTTPGTPVSDAGPATPTLTATAVSTSEIDLSWAAPTDGSHLELEEEGPGDNNFSVTPIPSPTTIDGAVVYEVTGLPADTQYAFRLRADLDGLASYSAAASATTQPSAYSQDGSDYPDDPYQSTVDLPTPTMVLTAGPEDPPEFDPDPNNYHGSFTFGTDAPDAPDRGDGQFLLAGNDPYHVLPFIGGWTDTGAVATGSADPVDFETYIPPSPYGYGASPAEIDDGFNNVSPVGNPITVTPSGPFPTTPELTSVPGANNTVVLDWTLPDDSNVTTRTVLFEVTNGQASEVSSSINASGTTLPAGPAGSKIFAVFYCTGGSYSLGAYSAYSNFVNADGTAPIPAAPQNLSATPYSDGTSAGIRLLWDNDSDNETGYTIQRSTSADFSTDLQTFTVGADVTSYVDNTGTSDSSVQPGTTYYYQVEATNGSDETSSAFSNTASAAVTLPTVSVTALDPNANFAGPDGNPQDAYLDFHRTGNLSSALTATVSYAGSTAVAGTDYSGTLPTTVTFPAGAQDVIIPVVPSNAGPGDSSVAECQVASGSSYTGTGSASINLAIHGLSVTLDGGTENDVLTDTTDGKEDLQPLTFTVPSDAGAGTVFKLSIDTNRYADAASLVDVWAADPTDDSSEAPLFGGGTDSYSWTVGQGGSTEPPTTLSVGAIGSTSLLGAIAFAITETDPSTQTADSTTKPAATEVPSLSVTLAIDDKDHITPAPENGSHDADVKAEGNIDQLGVLPLGQGRADRPGTAYTNALQIVGTIAQPAPSYALRWRRTVAQNSWDLTAVQKHQWLPVTRGTNPLPTTNDITNDAFGTVTPNAGSDKIYLYDNPAEDITPDDNMEQVGDYIYTEKQFTVWVEAEVKGVWKRVSPPLQYTQIILLQRIAKTGSVKNDWKGLENQIHIGTADLKMTADKLKQITGDTDATLF